MITNTMQPPVNAVAQLALNSMDSLQKAYTLAKQQTDSLLQHGVDTTNSPLSRWRGDGGEAAYTNAQQQLNLAMTTTKQLLNYHFPDSAWFAAVDTFLVKYSGQQADKSLAQYYWHKQTDSAYEIVANTYNLPDSLQQSLTDAYNAAQTAWTGLEQGQAMLKFKHNAGGVANVWGLQKLNSNNIAAVDSLASELEKDVAYRKVTPMQMPAIYAYKGKNNSSMDLGNLNLISSSEITCKNFQLINGYIVKFSDDDFNKIDKFGFNSNGKLATILFKDGRHFGNDGTSKYPKLAKQKDNSFLITDWYAETRFLSYDDLDKLKTQRYKDITNNQYVDIIVDNNISDFIINTQTITTCDDNGTLTVASSFDDINKKLTCRNLSNEECKELAINNKLESDPTELDDVSLVVYKKYYDGSILKIDSVNCQKDITSLTEYFKYKQKIWCDNRLFEKESSDHIWIEGYDDYTQTAFKDGQECNSQQLYNPGTNKGYLLLDFTDNNKIIKISYFINKTNYVALSNTKNVIAFVGGYRPNYMGFGEDNISQDITNDSHVDFETYWNTIDVQFIKNLKDRKAFYFDGSESIITSNHNAYKSVPLSKAKFGASLASSEWARYGKIVTPWLAILLADTTFDFDKKVVQLNTTPNIEGFNTRSGNGRIAGQDFETQLQAINFNKQTEKIDIVCHSMGYAYAVGIANYLIEKGYTMGRMYIIAAENPSGGGCDWSKFEEVWQYGANLGETGADPLYLQDGVAPQTAAPDINNKSVNPNGGRSFIPKDFEPKGFLDSHWIDNYGWIFKLNEQSNGYVKERK